MSVGLGFTNNFLEATVKAFENFNGGVYRQKRIDLVVKNIALFFYDRVLSINKTSISKSVKEAQDILEVAKVLDVKSAYKNEKATLWKIETSQVYTINLIKEGCTCEAFMHSHHECKHIYYCMLKYVDCHNIKQLKDTCNPFLLKETVLKHIINPALVHSFDLQYEYAKQPKPVKQKVFLPVPAELMKHSEKTAYYQTQRAIQQGKVVAALPQSSNAQEEYVVTKVIEIRRNKTMMVYWENVEDPSETTLDVNTEAVHAFVINLKKQLGQYGNDIFATQIQKSVKKITYLEATNSFLVVLSDERIISVSREVLIVSYNFLKDLKLLDIEILQEVSCE